MDIEKKLDALKKIKQADPPPFLYSNIEATIQSHNEGAVPVRWRWTAAVAFAVLLVLNIYVMVDAPKKNKSAGIESLVNELHLTSSNSLYNE